MDKMNQLLIFNQSQLISKITNDILMCNELSNKYGLTLCEKDINDLLESRYIALLNTQRIEFEQSIIPQLIYAFCDSPYIDQHNYKDTLLRLQDAFYYYKSETLDLLTDEQLINFMVIGFNDYACGSLDYLIETELHEMSVKIKEGYKIEECYE